MFYNTGPSGDDSSEYSMLLVIESVEKNDVYHIIYLKKKSKIQTVTGHSNIVCSF